MENKTIKKQDCIGFTLYADTKICVLDEKTGKNVEVYLEEDTFVFLADDIKVVSYDE